MQYFGESEDKQARIGHVIGDVFAVCVYVGVLILMFTHFT